MPYCAADGTCVECLESEQCDASAPACDPMSHACRECRADDECPSTICDVSAGTCLAESAIVYASPSGASSGACSKASPCSITQAFVVADNTRQAVSLLPGQYTANIVFGGKPVTVHGFGATVTAGAGNRAFEVIDGAHLRLEGVKVVNVNGGAQGAGIGCEPMTSSTPPRLELDQVSIDASSEAVVSNPCEVTITRSVLHSHGAAVFVQFANGAPVTSTIDRSILDGGNGVQSYFTGSVVRVTNSVISNTGPAGAVTGTDFGGSGGLGRAIVSFSTIYNSIVTCGSKLPACAGGFGSNGSPGACIDNSIIANFAGNAPQDTVTGSACVLDHTLVYPQASPLTGQNNKPGINPMLKDAGNGDYHLLPGSPAIDAADPAATNANDFDGTARPQGARSDLGAFEYKP
jgi:hypothetical protein